MRACGSSGRRLFGSAATTGHGPVCWWAKIGWVQFKRSHTLTDWKSYRISRERAGRWHIAFAVIPEPIPAPGVGGVVGVDRGVMLAVALSTGEMTNPGGLSMKEAERGLRLQRRLARAARGSNRRRKVRTLIGQLKSREGDRHKDWAQKTSTDLARRFDVIRLENLNIKGMTPASRGRSADVPQSGRWTVDEHDRITCIMPIIVRRVDGRGVIAGCALIQMSEQSDVACRR
jgi:transposase